MNNKEFDDIIKNKLESLNTDGSEDAWDLFKEKWDSSSILESEERSPEDIDLDAKIKKDMQKLRVPFNSKHWIILKEQLELEALFKKKLFVAKSVELVILAFLVIGILNVWPIQKDIYQIPVYDIPMVASVSVDKETAEKHKAQEEIRLTEQSNLKKEIYYSTKELVQKTLLSVADFSSGQHLSLTEESLSNNSIKNNRSEQKVLEIENRLDIQFSFISTIPQEIINVESANELNQNNTTNPIALLIPKELSNLIIPLRPIGFPDIVLNNKASNEDENTYLSFALGPKVNLINSPFDPVYEFDPYNIINTNFNISAKVHKEIGPIELYAGLGYTNTSYIPRIVDELYEPIKSQLNVASLESIKFKTFNVPVGVKYNVLESQKFQFYASAGVDMNIIADSEFIIQDRPVGRSQPAARPSSKNPVNSNTKLSQKEFNNGILTGGNLKDNLYATASVGLGINVNVSDRSGIFLEPRYSHFISSKGIGPNEDKVHGLSIDLGFRYQLN